jgi:hypothetical protein
MYEYKTSVSKNTKVPTNVKFLSIKSILRSSQNCVISLCILVLAYLLMTNLVQAKHWKRVSISTTY